MPQRDAAIITVRLSETDEAEVRLVVNPRARRISLKIDPATRAVIAVSPSLRALKRAEAFAQAHAGWIAAALARLPAARGLVDGGTIPFRGDACVLRHEPGLAPPRLEDGPPLAIVAGGLDSASFAQRVRRYLIGRAREALEARVAAHCATLGVSARRITVKDTRSRWGSCSQDGSLAFSWRVILAPPDVLDYLAAHEVAHLREMNHSARFWRCVAQLKPDFAAAQAWLKRNGAALHAIDGG